jgi:uncharacterized repeat protein (TIGR04138 family)
MLDPTHPISELLRHDKRYHFEAYLFVFHALNFAQKELGMGMDSVAETSECDSDEESPELERHVCGQDLCEAMRQYAHREFGYLAKSVLNHWGITSTGDFGEIVFNLIEIGQMRKTPSDRREDFNDVYDFEQGFRESFQITNRDNSNEEPHS